jgi:hypothetical protein
MVMTKTEIDLLSAGYGQTLREAFARERAHYDAEIAGLKARIAVLEAVGDAEQRVRAAAQDTLNQLAARDHQLEALDRKLSRLLDDADHPPEPALQ